MGRIVRNVARCKKCGEVLESVHEQDKICCKCKSLVVGGGLYYLLRSGVRDVDWEELSVILPPEAAKAEDGETKG